MAWDFDVGVIGGGPAGASAGAYLARAGLRVCVLESEHFPRPHVGESLVPSSNRVFQELGLVEKLLAAGFPKKYGAAWTAADRGPVYQTDWKAANTHPSRVGADTHARIAFGERAQPGVELDHTFHVDRAKFDLLLLQHAHELGATVYEGVRARHVELEARGARIHVGFGKKEVPLDVGLVVDASGRRTLLGTQLGLKVKDPVFDQYALHTWFEGYDRRVLAKHDEQADYIFIHFLPLTNTWVWQIPITDSITSVGVVTQRQNFAKSRRERADFFWACLDSRPELGAALRAAHQVTPLREEGDYSYAMTQLAGDRFILLGDAGRFVDPIFSTGVSIALNSARFAAPDILAAAEHGRYDRAAFAQFERTLRRGTRNWYEFITVYYRLNVLFTHFINDPAYRLDVLALLQGDVYDEERPEVLEKMRAIVEEVERDETHLWHRSLGTLTANAFAGLAAV